MAGSRIRVVHVINSFCAGGAEAMLSNLLRRSNCDRFESSVIALIDDLTVAGPIVRAGIPLATVGMKPGIPDPRGLVRLARHLRRVQPDVVQTWMDHSNLIGGLAARLGSRAKIVWGIHASTHLPGVAKRLTRLTVSACARISHHVPSWIVLCAERCRPFYRDQGFASDRFVVIPNGFDTTVFRPNPDARLAVRRELGLASDTLVIGLVARYDPVKDHGSFLRAAAIVARRNPEVRFILCGANVDHNNSALVALVNQLGLAHHCHLLGRRQDVPAVQAAVDIAASSSISEAFPLAVGEAMACGIPCTVTDVGDSAILVGDSGRIVPPRDPEAMAAAWSELAAIGRRGRTELGEQARRRINDQFELGVITRRYEQLYESLVSVPEDPRVMDQPVPDQIRSAAA